MHQMFQLYKDVKVLCLPTSFSLTYSLTSWGKKTCLLRKKDNRQTIVHIEHGKKINVCKWSTFEGSRSLGLPHNPRLGNRL